MVGWVGCLNNPRIEGEVPNLDLRYAHAWWLIRVAVCRTGVSCPQPPHSTSNPEAAVVRLARCCGRDRFASRLSAKPKRKKFNPSTPVQKRSDTVGEMGSVVRGSGVGWSLVGRSSMSLRLPQPVPPVPDDT